jgi:hypothetical protein
LRSFLSIYSLASVMAHSELSIFEVVARWRRAGVREKAYQDPRVEKPRVQEGGEHVSHEQAFHKSLFRAGVLFIIPHPRGFCKA